MSKTLIDRLSHLIRPIFEIRPGERFKTFIMFWYFFLTIGLINVLKPVQKSLFVTEFGAKNIHFAYIAEGVFLIFWVSLFNHLAKKVAGHILYIGVLLFCMTNLLGFWVLLHFGIPYLSAAFYVWQAAFSVTIVTVFWILANDLYNTNEAKRLFGLILGGGSAGGVFGGILTNKIVHIVKTEGLLLVAAAGLLICTLLVALLWQLIPSSHQERRLQDKPQKEPIETNTSTQHSIFRIFSKSLYLQMLLALVMIAKIASAVVDNQFTGMVELTFAGRPDAKEAMTAFLGLFQGVAVNTTSFILQFLVTSLCLRYLGVGTSIWILPTGLFALSIAGLLRPSLWVSGLMRLFDGGVNYSIQQASKEVFYLPLAPNSRRRIKPVIDMLGFRTAKLFGGLFIWIFASLFAVPVASRGVLVLLVIPIWILVIWNMRKSYSKLLRDHLLMKGQYKKAVLYYPDDVMQILKDEKSFQEIHKFIQHHSTSVRKLAAASYLFYIQSSKNLENVRAMVDQIFREEALHHEHNANSNHELGEHDERFLKNNLPGLFSDQKNEDLGTLLFDQAPTILQQLEKSLQRSDQALEVKRHIVRLMEYMPVQETIDVLMRIIISSKDYTLRFITLRALNRLHDKNPALLIDRKVIKSEMIKEVKIYQNIQRLRYQYEKSFKPRSSGDEDYLAVALGAILDENFERIFRFLDLLYPHEIIHIIHDNVLYHDEHAPERLQALELLSNTVEPNILVMLRPVLEQQPIPASEEETVEILKDFSNSSDRWFSLTSLFLAEKFGSEKIISSNREKYTFSEKSSSH